MKKILLILLTFAIQNSAFAADSAAGNEAALVDYLRSFTYETTQSAYVYHWFNGNGRNSVWKSALSSSSNVGWDHFQNNVNRYWQAFCPKNSPLNPADCKSTGGSEMGMANMYGPGLYAASDPVTTASYGKGDGWVLLQIHLPKGLQIMDMQRDGSNSIPVRAQKVLSSFGCPADWAVSSGALNSLLAVGGIFANGSGMYQSPSGGPIVLSDSCALNIRKILKDDLKIDGFLYGYQASHFKECDLTTKQNVGGFSLYQTGGNNQLRNVAFVLANAKAFSPDDIKVFTAKTSDDQADRIRIQSLFYKVDTDSPGSGDLAFYQSLKYPQYPNYQVANVFCQSPMPTPIAAPMAPPATCQYQVMLCPTTGGSCVNIPAPQPPPPPTVLTVMTSQHLPSYLRGMFKSLLWSDLEGVAIDTELGPWVKQNLFGCSPTPEEDSDN